MEELNRRQKLAAELFGYSYEHYEDHLDIGNIRFDDLMPNEVEILEIADRENWNRDQIIEAIDIDEDELDDWIRHFHAAKEIVDAESPVESFKRGVSYSIIRAIEDSLINTSDINRLVTQICYRAADLAYLMKKSGGSLYAYIDELREETQDDRDYWQQVFLHRWEIPDSDDDNSAG